MNDRILIWRFKRGSTDALRRIYMKYGDYLLTLAMALLRDIHEAEDVVHDVFCSVIKSRTKIRAAGSLRPYLSTCVVNRARDVLRKKRLSAEPSNPAGTAVSPDDAADAREQSKRLNDALARISQDQREVILLRLYGGMKFKEIAEVQKTSINTAKSRYQYGLRKMQSLLNGEVR
ncbi:MAG: RNA polymerase sigma factor [Planctomycetota bacterium]|jgi:RNA polymerase sigma-70 factor (ECF subfamily)